MNTKQINAANADEKIMQLYEMAFPEDEQIPWDDLMRLVGEMPLDFTAYYEEKRSSASPSSILVSHSTGFGTLLCERNCEAKVMASRSSLS